MLTRLFSYIKSVWGSILVTRKLALPFSACLRVDSVPISTLIFWIWKTVLLLKLYLVRHQKTQSKKTKGVNLVDIVNEESVEAAVAALKVEAHHPAVSLHLALNHHVAVHDLRNHGDLKKRRNMNLRFHLSVRRWPS